MVLTGSLRRRVLHSNRRRLKASKCRKVKTTKRCKELKRCTYAKGPKRSFCRRVKNRRTRRFRKRAIFRL